MLAWVRRATTRSTTLRGSDAESTPPARRARLRAKNETRFEPLLVGEVATGLAGSLCLEGASVGEAASDRLVAAAEATAPEG